MPKPRVPESKLTINYWQNFLRAKNLLGPIMQETEEIEAKRKPTPPALEPDMQTFIERVAERLTPLEGLDQTGKLRALNVREQFRRELTDVFLGKQDWNKWFDKTKTTLGLHTVTFMKILHQCLEGLRSPEAQSLRQDYEAALARIRTSA
jgi:alpha-L-arabinofuranosidase